ncbi:MAG: triphosphoribosyl-dephospho-CoA synthase [Halobacteriaceae archaeon]
MTDRDAVPADAAALADRPLGPARTAELALHLEVASTPKPGNVDRERDHEDLRFAHFAAGAVGAGPGLAAAADPGVPLGDAFERAVAGMSRQGGGNTQFGALLLLCPLVRASVRGEPGAGTAAPESPGEDMIAAVVGDTTVDDAVAFYRAFEHVDVAVDDPPPGEADLDVRRGAAAESALRERGLTLGDVLARAADRDGVAAEWAAGFPRTREAATRIRDDDGPVTDRAARAFLALLGEAPDTFVATGHGDRVAESVRERAAALDAAGADRSAVSAFADTLVSRGVNPGTTADVVAGGCYLALRGGVDV